MKQDVLMADTPTISDLTLTDYWTAGRYEYASHPGP